MDPLAHTLFGAALAETGLKRCSRYATATLLVGANLPDIDAVAMAWGADASLLFRRGWSHGVLALLILPLLLTAAVWLWHRWHHGDEDEGPPWRPGALLALACLAVWSHPLLDWLNTYGVRLLMPFDGRWFYGDTLFIVDPWLWLLAAAGVVLTRSRSGTALAGWALLALLTSVLVLGTPLAPWPVKALWLAGIGTLAALRWRRPPARARRLIAHSGFAALVLYVCVAWGLARLAESGLAAQHPAPLTAQANPVPGRPHLHRVVLVYADRYRVVHPDGAFEEVPRREPDAVVRAALADESVRGFVTWMRHPYWQVEEVGDGWRVSLRDLRYVGPDETPRGIGFAQVFVPRDAVETADGNGRARTATDGPDHLPAR